MSSEKEKKKRWRLPRRKLCLFVDSACLLASASHMNIFPNVTRPQLRAKNQHHSDEATSSSLPVRWPAVQRRRRRCGGGGIAQAAAVSTAFYTHAYALLWLVGSSCHVSCLFAHCRRRRGHTAPSRLGSLRRRRVLSSCLMCALQALSSLLPCEHLLLLKCVRFWPFVRVKTSYNLTPPEQECWRLSKLGGNMPNIPSLIWNVLMLACNVSAKTGEDRYSCPLTCGGPAKTCVHIQYTYIVQHLVSFACKPIFFQLFGLHFYNFLPSLQQNRNMILT